MQRRTLGHRKGRRFEQRNLDLVLFVERHERRPLPAMSPETAGALCKRWNVRYAKKSAWQFTDGRDLARAYQRAKEGFFLDDEYSHALVALAIVRAEMKRRSQFQGEIQGLTAGLESPSA